MCFTFQCIVQNGLRRAMRICNTIPCDYFKVKAWIQFSKKLGQISRGCGFGKPAHRCSFLALLENHVLTDDGIKLAKEELVRQLGRIFPRKVSVARVGCGQQLDKHGLELFCHSRFQRKRVGRGEIRNRKSRTMRGGVTLTYTSDTRATACETRPKFLNTRTREDAPSCLLP